VVSDEQDITLNNEHSPELWSSPIPPLSLLLELLVSFNTQSDDLATADLVVLTEGQSDHLLMLDGPATHSERKQKTKDLHAILDVCVWPGHH
jgi:hypothetical protein